MQQTDIKLKKKIKLGSLRKGQLIFIWSAITLPIITWLVFFWYVNLSSFVQAFQDMQGTWTTYNFKVFFDSITNKDPTSNDLYIAIGNTMKFFVLDTFVKFPMQIFVAFFLFKKIWGYKFFRIIFYFPVIISAIAMTGVFKSFVHANGPIADICEALSISLPKNGLLATPDTVIPTIMVYSIWDGIGLHMLLLCGAMVRIPIEVLEAGRLDGIGAFREFWQIILPMIWATLSTIIVLRLTNLLNSSGPILLMLKDYPTAYSYKAITLDYWIFSKVWETGNPEKAHYGLVSAAGLCLTFVTVPIIMFIKWLIVEKIPKVEY